MDEVKKNKAYAGQVVDVVRSKNRISFNDCLVKMTEKEGDPYLNIFAPQSIYLMSLLNFSTNKSVRANLPLRDLPLIYKKTDYAEAEIFNQQKLASGKVSEPEKQPEKNPGEEIPIAFTPLKIGTFSGKTPGDILLTAEDPEKAKNDLMRQAKFLKGKLAAYPANQTQIDAIESAIEHFDLGVLADIKPGAQKDGNEPVESPAASGTYTIYKTPIKHQKRKNKNGKNECYSVSITCTPAKTYPYKIEIMNCYAPLRTLANGLQPIMMDQAEDQQTASIDLTEGEWLYIISCLQENTQNTKTLWYQELRAKDENNRWKGNKVS